MRFENKIVLVTGAGKNTGRAIALAFAGEGATVLINDQSAASLRPALAAMRRRGFSKILPLAADIGARGEVEAMFREIAARVRRLDVLVNNAAHLGIGPGFLETGVEFFSQVVRVNLEGTFHVSQQAARLMRRQRSGAIVNVGSNVSARSIRNRVAYVASKGGIDALTTAMAVELANFGIRVNTLAPGYIHSDRWAALAKGEAARRRRNVPLGREARPEDIARAVLFLASDEAAAITGVRLVADGGCSAQLFPSDAEA